jgi:Subtilase family
MIMPSGPDDLHSDARMALWRRARHTELCEGHVSDGTGAIGQPDVLEGPGFLYRPRQILLETGVMQTQPVESELKRHGGELDTDLSDRFSKAGLPIQAYLMPPEVYIPGLVAQLRERPYGEWGAPAANVSANHVFCGEADYHGGPYGEPISASPFSEAKYGKPAKGAPEIAVLDTGYDTQIETLHPGLDPRVAYQPGTEENPLTGGYLAQEAGHGTFIDGIIMQVAPQVSIRQVQLLNPAGVTDDGCLALAISALANSVPVINVSLGGYTQGDIAPPASSAAIAALTDNVVVVAAAGNNHSPEPFWPAALGSVVSVGALDTTQGAPQVAGFSNYGNWVDVYAPGTTVYSTYLQATWMLPNDTPPPRPIDGWAIWSGTSFAAPQVTAAIANTLLQSGGTARQAAYTVLSQAQWIPVTGVPGITGVMAYVPPGPGVIFPA